MTFPTRFSDAALHTHTHNILCFPTVSLFYFFEVPICQTTWFTTNIPQHNLWILCVVCSLHTWTWSFDYPITLTVLWNLSSPHTQKKTLYSVLVGVSVKECNTPVTQQHERTLVQESCISVITKEVLIKAANVLVKLWMSPCFFCFFFWQVHSILFENL